MHLVAPLASGVNGAENGKAYIYRRGTSSLVSYYTDFEATEPVTQTSDGIDLDSHGGAIVYVDVMARVVVKDADGVVVREFTAGAKDSATEVISTSFTGTDYVSGATGVSKPTTLQSVLNRWITSAGTDDFEVLVGGSPMSLRNAVQGLSGVFYNVKNSSYGAVGDGTTDDYAACAAAISACSAAGGGIVLFPPGTYRITQMLTVPYTVSIMGCGPENTTVKLDAATASGYSAFYFSGTTSTHYQYQTIECLRVRCSQVNIKMAVKVKDAYLLVRNVFFEGSDTGFGDALLGAVAGDSPTSFNVLADKCTFKTAPSNIGAFAAFASASSSGVAEFSSCSFVATGGTFSTPAAVDMTGTTASLFVHDCTVDITAATSSNSGVVFRSAGDITIRNNKLNAPANGSSYLTDMSAVDGTAGFGFESGNALEGNGALLNAGGITNSLLDNLILMSRNGRVKTVSTTGTSVALDTFSFSAYLIQKTSGATITVTPDVLPVGHRFTLSFWNDGTGGNVTVTLGTGFKGTNMTVANDKIQTVEFISQIGPSGTVRLYQIGTPRDETE